MFSPYKPSQREVKKSTKVSWHRINKSTVLTHPCKDAGVKKEVQLRPLIKIKSMTSCNFEESGDVRLSRLHDLKVKKMMLSQSTRWKTAASCQSLSTLYTPSDLPTSEQPSFNPVRRIVVSTPEAHFHKIRARLSPIPSSSKLIAQTYCSQKSLHQEKPPLKNDTRARKKEPGSSKYTICIVPAVRKIISSRLNGGLQMPEVKVNVDIQPFKAKKMNMNRLSLDSEEFAFSSRSMLTPWEDKW